MTQKETVPGAIELDRFVGPHPPAQVLRFVAGEQDAAFVQEQPRNPHRHDYHELFLVEHGVTEHQIDAAHVTIGACQALMIGRGQVHTLLAAEQFTGTVLRVSDELLVGGAQRVTQGWTLLAQSRAPMTPPRRELQHARATLDLLADELEQPRDTVTDQLIASTLATVLGLLHRWQASAARELPPPVTDPDVALVRRFLRLLEAEHAQHHEASWYAEQLGISTNHLAATLTRLTGSSTKRHITDRLMTEVARLLRFTDMSVQQIAYRLGYTDPLYLSRAFKVHAGESPSTWRERHAGTTS